MYRVDLRNAQWIKSSYSNGNGNCVEVARNVPGVLPVRDSKRADGPVLVVGAFAWSAFVGGLKGEVSGG